MKVEQQSTTATPATPETARAGTAADLRPASEPPSTQSSRQFLALAFGLPLLLTALLSLATLWPRAPFALDVGFPGDRLVLGNVYGDERVAEYSYRWTGRDQQPATLTIPGWGAVTRARLTLRAQTPRERGPVEVSILAGGQSVGQVTLDSTMTARTIELALPPAAGHNGDLTLLLDAPTSRVPGDSRTLGIILDRLTLEPLDRDSGAYWRTLWPHLVLALALTLALLLLVGPQRGRLTLVGHFGAGLIPPLALFIALPWTLALLPPALLMSGLLLVVCWRRRLAGWLASGWVALDRPRLALIVALSGLAIYTALVLPHLLTVPWINHADYADNAVVARNIVRGNGFTVDYVAQFYRDWPAVRHPADTWPPLQPLLIAGAFALFGVSVGVAKLPNLLVMLGLLWLVYRAGAWLWSSRTGLIAALLVAVHPALFEGVIYPLNDTTFTLLAFASLLLLWGLTSAAGVHPDDEDRHLFAARFWRSRWSWALLGAVAGLLLLSKPSGALLLLGGSLWALWYAWRRGAARPVLTRGALAAASALAIYLPWMVRNIVTFGIPFYSTEQYDAWILIYRDWEQIYRAYAGRLPLPHRSLLVGYGLDAVSDKIIAQFRTAWTELLGGEVVPALLLPLAILGGAVVRGRRTLLASFGCAIGCYALFVLTYWHYETRYTLVLIPWVALFASVGLSWLADRLAAVTGHLPALGLALVALGFVVVPQVIVLSDDWSASSRRPNSLLVADWFRENTPANVVVMTRNPWELSFHADRLSLMIPTEDLPTIRAVAAAYGATYLQLDHLNDPHLRRPALGPLYAGPDEWQGFRKVYDRRDQQGEGLLIYQFPPASP